MNTELHKQDAKVHCNDCSQNYLCGVLKAALEIMNAEAKTSTDTLKTETFYRFKEKLDNYGYSYPDGEFPCWLSDKRPVLRDLCEEAEEIVKAFERKN